MKAMFVNNVDWSGDAYDEIHMEIGDEFHIVGEAIGYGKRGVPCICWEFAEFVGQDALFDKRNFATLPSESEEQAIEQEHEAIIYQR